MLKKHIASLLCALACSVVVLALSVEAYIGESANFEIKVTGDRGLQLSGGINMISGTNVRDESYDIVVPWSRTVRTEMLGVYFMKDDEEGFFRIDIYKDGVLATSGSTSAKYGSVMLTTN